MSDIFDKFDPQDDQHQAQLRQLSEDLVAQGPEKRVLHEQDRNHFEFKPGDLTRMYGSRFRQQTFLHNIHHMIHPTTKRVCHLGGLAQVYMNCPGCGKAARYMALITRAQGDAQGEYWVVEAVPCCHKFFWTYMPNSAVEDALKNAHIDTRFNKLLASWKKQHIDPKRT